MTTKSEQVKPSAIDRAIGSVGSQTALAKLLGVNQQNISYWKTSSVPVEYCLAIENETGVSRRDLRPDDWHRIWPELAANA